MGVGVGVGGNIDNVPNGKNVFIFNILNVFKVILIMPISLILFLIIKDMLKLFVSGL